MYVMYVCMYLEIIFNLLCTQHSVHMYLVVATVHTFVYVCIKHLTYA